VPLAVSSTQKYFNLPNRYPQHCWKNNNLPVTQMRITQFGIKVGLRLAGLITIRLTGKLSWRYFVWQ
jgi:hypothetical protein